MKFFLYFQEHGKSYLNNKLYRKNRPVIILKVDPLNFLILNIIKAVNILIKINRSDML